MLEISPKISFRTFGYIGSGSFKERLYGKLFGVPNLLKRLQARDIMSALSLKPADVVLDFGCGSGYISVEMAKIARTVYGVDTNPFASKLRLPTFLEKKLFFHCVSGEGLPFEDEKFDVILASEVLPMISQPNIFVQEIKRLLKKNGRLVVVNGLDRPWLQNAYKKNSFLLRLIKKIFPQSTPASYEEYSQRLNNMAGTAINSFMTANGILNLLNNNGLSVTSQTYSPSNFAGAFMAWDTFIKIIRFNRWTQEKFSFTKYILFSIISLFESKKSDAGLIVVCQK